MSSFKDALFYHPPHKFEDYPPRSPDGNYGQCQIITVNLEFEASIFKVIESEQYRTNLKTGTYIQLRCVNARERMHELMLNYANQVPENIPKYYGRLAIANSN